MNPTPELIREIEDACEQLSAGVGAGRVAAENFLVNVRKAENSLQLARQVLESSQRDSACFQAACMLKEGVLRDWSKLTADDRREMKSYVLQYVIQKKLSMKHFVRHQLLQAVAIMVKRGWFEEAPEYFNEMMTYVHTLVGEEGTRDCGIFLMRALLDEFSSSNRSVVGLTWEIHHQCQQRFHAEGHLKTFFTLAMSMIAASLDFLKHHQKDIDALTSSSGSHHWLIHCVEVINQSLNWDFTDAQAKGGVVGSFAPSLNGRNDVITPGAAWRDVFVQGSTLDLFYSLYATCRGSSNMAHVARQCLVDLAAIRGDVFPDDASRTMYLDHSLNSILALISAHSNDSEFVDVALILLRLVRNFQASTLVRSSHAQQHLSAMGEFTCMLMSRRSSLGDGWAAEALDHMLELWCGLSVAILHQDDDRCHMEAIGGFTAKIFSCFVEKCMHEASQEVQEWDQADDEHEDKSVLEERLTAIGCIGRLKVGEGMQQLVEMLAQRLEAIRSVVTDGRELPAMQASVALEQIHWLVQIAGHLIADDGEGEVPVVPEVISRLSSELAARNMSTEDPLILLTNKVVDMSNLLDFCRERKRKEFLSPLVVQTSTWYLSRWSQTYLLPAPSDRFPLSPSLQQHYGPGEGATSVLSFLIDRSLSNFSSWGSEEDVVNATSQLVLALAMRKPVAKLLLGTPGWSALSQMMPNQLAKSPGSKWLNPAALSPVMQALCCSVTAVEVQEQRSILLRDLIGPIAQQTCVLLEHEMSSKVPSCNASEVLLRAARMLHGACKSADFYTYDSIFELVIPVVERLPVALHALREHSHVTESILLLFVVIGEVQVSFLSGQQMRMFNQACLHLLQTFTKIEAHGRRGSGELQEADCEWLRDHMLSLLQLLLHLARKDVVDFSNEVRGEEMDVADVVLFGLSLLQPLITPESLQYPAISKEFFSLLGWLIESYPHKVSVMDRNMLDPIVACLHHGLQQADSDTARASSEAIDALATYQISTMREGGSYLLKEKHPDALGLFLQALLEMLLFKQFNRTVLDSSCDALLSLLCCEQAKFGELMTQVINSQVLESNRTRVGEATQELIRQVTTAGPAVQRAAKLQFRSHMRKFLGSIRPFLVTI
ncbi:hypothetical protein GUITHDRAFT_113055 [Guillardia theta CCMP2712]|uniref:Exportin-4 n=2 Tax=Guillardia theta TaxID=55529 RepID=L1IXJ0_GUITC|nr:hypothetical protein GUITHDRAFT_113055 [Guillardia theta CCMP2712]EKX40787.1 hypothetical protein GUITHDRAFT_113055 [Guillardia theta CCMP2712]|mmetsp:Transcript_15917/g.53259  ORF Transcript_15917/g.53259 Transcript_15917/m.53259 type:complete len:1115 (+) Transcript_15917:265-3609(+)|eukprot:XP_005827767.1 hypothetical protein GUITHDRAFT_113055 [Guillardia theta CCMP2712]